MQLTRAIIIFTLLLCSLNCGLALRLLLLFLLVAAVIVAAVIVAAVLLHFLSRLGNYGRFLLVIRVLI